MFWGSNPHVTQQPPRTHGSHANQLGPIAGLHFEAFYLVWIPTEPNDVTVAFSFGLICHGSQRLQLWRNPFFSNTLALKWFGTSCPRSQCSFVTSRLLRSILNIPTLLGLLVFSFFGALPFLLPLRTGARLGLWFFQTFLLLLLKECGCIMILQACYC